MSDPERIWLQNANDARATGDRLWCQDKVWPECDEQQEKAAHRISVDEATAEARKAAFIEAAEIAEKVAAGQDQEWRTDTAMRVAYAIRAKAEGENHG